MQEKLPASEKSQGCVTPRGHGGGDGIRQNISERKRVPVSSARKFNPRAPKDEKLRLKLETAIMDEIGKKREMGTPKKHQAGLLRAASVAEITPTKSKKRLSTASTEDSCEIYATPRPLRDVPKKKFCLQERSSCWLFRKLILLAWRRSRINLKEADATLKKHEVQVSQLEMQKDVLIKLRVFEGQKREEAQAECQKFKKSVDLLELENNQLNEDTQNLQTSLELVQNELKVAKAENDFLSEQSIKMQEIIARKKNEKISLEQRVRLQEDELFTQKSLVAKLRENLLFMEKKLKTSETNYRIKEKKYAQLKCEFKKQLDSNNSYTDQLKYLEEEKTNISFKVEDLEAQLNDYIRSCEVLKDVNDELVQEVRDMSLELEEEKKRTWLKNSKEFALLSLLALQKFARVMVPAYLDGPTNF